MLLTCGSRTLDLSTPKIMGILNTTPDSFFDGGSCYASDAIDVSAALFKAEAMIDDGAAILDIGGESTRPGASPVTVQQELDRVLPVIEAVSASLDVVISLDSSQPEVIRAGCNLGVGLVNDVRALRIDGALEAAAEFNVAVCLMHMQGDPKTMQHNPHYDDVLAEVEAFLVERSTACEAVGIPKKQVILDPGIGFGKKDEHNLALLNGLSRFADAKQPVLIGLSRKSMIGRLLERELPDRLAGSLGFALVAMQNGANILRVHDVRETHDMMRVFELTRSE